MPPEVALVWNLTRATLAHDAAADEYREPIVKRWGRPALVSVAFAITAARIDPTVKYALGHGKACMRVVVGGMPVAFDHGRVPAPPDMAVRTIIVDGREGPVQTAASRNRRRRDSGALRRAQFEQAAAFNVSSGAAAPREGRG